jgi:putative membrane protein
METVMEDAVGAMGGETAGIDWKTNITRRGTGPRLPKLDFYRISRKLTYSSKELHMKLTKYAPMAFAGLGTIAIVFRENAVFAYRGESCEWGFGSGAMGGWGMGGFGPLSMILFWGLLITGIIFLVRWSIQTFKKQPAHSRNASDPLDIIRKRYATGEIDQDEFKRMQQALGRNSE